MIDLDELKRLAVAAVPGPWDITEDSAKGKSEAWCCWHDVGPFSMPGKCATANDEFIAAANPAAILGMIEWIESDSKDIEDHPMSAEDAIRLAELWRAGKMIGGDIHAVCDALLTEVERLQEQDASARNKQA